MKKENKRKVFIAQILLFTVYLLFLCYFLFFAESMGRTFSQRQYQYNLKPLKEIKRFWKYRHSLGAMSVGLNLAGNVLAFVPFGFFLPTIFQRCRKCLPVVFFSFEFSLLVEIVQLFCKVGSFDVDDIFLNTIGGLFGYIVYFCYHKLKNRRKKQSCVGDKNETKKTV